MSGDTPKKKVVFISVSGQPIALELATSEKFDVSGTVRPSSISKPNVEVLRNSGVTIVPLDWQTAPASELEALFAGVDTVISTCTGFAIPDQTKLVDAAKVAQVKRFIPCHWGTVCPRGGMKLEDMKRAISDYIVKVGVPYTIITVGFWYEVLFPPVPPYVPPVPEYAEFADLVYQTVGTGNVKTAGVNREHVGKFVARIIDDEGTINKGVLANEDELTINEVWDIAEKYVPGKISPLRVRVSQPIPKSFLLVLMDWQYLLQLSDDEVKKQLKEGEGKLAQFYLEYMKSAFIEGHNTEAAAREAGWIIARERYPDVQLQPGAEWAKTYYSK
ncbi:hypothetical protein HGRIS_006642 [Hohenbuehelia grisea]|uniref:NmrA-like domain-containing protein n=1 Tax=Hohenbuehelia grisea TaxID=104357 RepID=A0ABR3JA57_9AGAR